MIASTAHGGLHAVSGRDLQSAADGASPSQDVVRQLLDEIISAVVLQVPVLQAVQQDDISALVPPTDTSKLDFSSSKPSAARRSAITALKEGIDARCDEDNSIEAMQMALDCSADEDLLLPTPSRPTPQKGTTLQDLTDLCSSEFAAESLAVEGPADSWLRASADLPQSSAVTAATTAAAAAAAPYPGLQLSPHGQSWEEYVSTMDNRLQTSSALPSATQHAPAAVAPAASKTASKSGTAANTASSPKSTKGPAGYAATSPKEARGSPTSVRMSPRALKPAAASPAAAGPGGSSPSTPKSARVGRTQATNSYAAGYAAVRSPPKSPTPGSTPAVAVAVKSGIPTMLGSPQSPRAAALTPAAARNTKIPQQPQQPQQQQEQGSGLERAESLDKAGALPTRIPSGLLSGACSPAPLQQQQQQNASGVGGAGMVQGLDVLPASAGRRSSSDNGSASSSRRSLGGAQRDEASAAWMSSLRSGGPSSVGSYRRTGSRSSSTTATPSQGSRSSSYKQLHATKSQRNSSSSTSSSTAAAPAAAAHNTTAAAVSTPPVGIKTISRSSSRTTPLSAEPSSSSASKHAHLSLRRSGSLTRSASGSPHFAAAACSGSNGGKLLSPSSTESDAAPTAPQGHTELQSYSTAIQPRTGATATELGPLSRGPAAAVHGGPIYSAGGVSSAMQACNTSMGNAADSWLTPRPGPVSAGGAEGLLGSDHEIMADPTAVRLFLELDEEIEADGRAAVAAAEAAAAAEATAAADAAAAAEAAAAEAAAKALSVAPAPAAATAEGGDSGMLGLEKSWQSESSRGEGVEAAAAPDHHQQQQQQRPGVLGDGGVNGMVDGEAEPQSSHCNSATVATVAAAEAVEVVGVSEAQNDSTPAEELRAGTLGLDGGAHEEDTEGEGQGVAEQPSCGCRCVIM